MSEMIYLFISYSHQDAEEAQHLVAVLKRFDVPHFIDTDVRTGENFEKAIQEALGFATHVVVLVSKESIRSPWVQNEISRARSAEKRIFPIVLGNDVELYPAFPHDIKYLQLDPKAIDEDQVARDLVDYLFDPDGVVPYKLFKHYGKRLPSEVFAAELLTQPVVLSRQNGKLRVRINRDEVKNVVISNKGKNVTLGDRYVTPRSEEWLDLDRRIQQLVVGTSQEAELKIPTQELPLRWASGGVLSIIKCCEARWVPLFFRDIDPVGWNISLGSSERCFHESNKLMSDTDFSLENELSQPWKSLLREFLEETLIIDREPLLGETCQRRVFQFDNIYNVGVSVAQAAEFSGEHLRLRQNDDCLTFGQAGEIRVRIVDDTDVELTIIGQSSGNHKDLDVLVVINPLELGIEVIKVFKYEVDEHDCMLDGEILRTGMTRELVRMPFALVSLEYLWRAFGSPDYVHEFTGDERLPAVKAHAPFAQGDLRLFGWDVRRRRQIFDDSDGLARGLEKTRYKAWCDNFADAFEHCLETSDPAGLPVRFTPATAKVINTYFNCSAHGRRLAAKFSDKQNRTR